MDTVTLVQILDDCVSVSHFFIQTFLKSICTILLPVMGKQLDRRDSLALVWQLVLEKENSEFEPAKTTHKNSLWITSYSCVGVGKFVYTI